MYSVDNQLKIKDLKDFYKFCINDELKNFIFCESDRTNSVNKFTWRFKNSL